MDFKKELWKTLDIQLDNLERNEIPPIKSFYDYQDLSEMYEVRGILPQADWIFKDQD